MFTVTKRFPGICTGHRHWRAGTHCALIHGYDRIVELTMAVDSSGLKDGWVIDLGDLKQVRQALEEAWDHRTLIASDDPLLADIQALEAKGAIALNIMDVNKGHGPSLEQSCMFVYDLAKPLIDVATQGRVAIIKVEIWEKPGNRAAYIPWVPGWASNTQNKT